VTERNVDSHPGNRQLRSAQFRLVRFGHTR
jgi:hypothetical protein